MSYIDQLMSILNMEQHSKWVPFGDVLSHPTLVGTYFTFINFNIEAPGLGYLETCPPTLGYVGTCYFTNTQHHGYGSTTLNPCNWSLFAGLHTVSIIVGHMYYRVSLPLDIHFSWLWVIHKPTLNRSLFSTPHTISVTVGHKNYKVSLSSDLCSSFLWVIQKPTVHQCPFSGPHTISITIGHKHYRVSLSSDLRSSWLWVNHIKPFSSMALHIQQRLRRRELHAMENIAS